MRISMTELKRRVGQAYAALRVCRLCPRNCGVNRLRGEEGACHTGKIAKVASHNVHTGEEPPISGVRGSGTIFFSYCNLRCKFCQNYPISQQGVGSFATPQELAKMMLSLQERGCHNVNLVTPAHVVPQFLAGLYLARRQGFDLPIVYNSSGYEGFGALQLLDGVVDIYLPDIKYSKNDVAIHYSAAPNYWEIVRPVIKEMFRQVGLLRTDVDGIGISGLIIRHLVLPHGLSGTDQVLEFIASEISPDVHISFMSQYFPATQATNDEKINRRLTHEEYDTACGLLEKYGLENGWVQPY